MLKNKVQQLCPKYFVKAEAHIYHVTCPLSVDKDFSIWIKSIKEKNKKNVYITQENEAA